jgi:hypothetical protein
LKQSAESFVRPNLQEPVMKTTDNTVFNFLQEFAPVIEADLLFVFAGFKVYRNIPLINDDPSIYYLTIIPVKFNGVSESSILAVKFNEPNDLSKTLDVKTRLFIYTGNDLEQWEFLTRGIIQVLSQSRIRVQNGNYRIRIQKIN